MMTSDYVIREGVSSMTHRSHATSAARRWGDRSTWSPCAQSWTAEGIGTAVVVGMWGRNALTMPRARSGPTLGPRGGVRLSRTVWLVCVCVWCSDTGLPLIAPDCHASWQSVVQRHGSAVDARLDYGLTGPGPHSPFTHPVWEAPGQDLLGLLGLSAVAVERGSCVSCAACGVCRAVCGVGW